MSSGTLPPTTSQGSFIPQQHKPGFPERSQYSAFYHLSQTYFHSFQHLLANSPLFSPVSIRQLRSFFDGSADTLKTRRQITPCFSMNSRPRPRRLVSAVVLGENATFTLNTGKCFPRPQSSGQLAPSTFFTRLTSVPILSSHRQQKDEVFKQPRTRTQNTDCQSTLTTQTILQ